MALNPGDIKVSGDHALNRGNKEQMSRAFEERLLGPGDRHREPRDIVQ